FAIAGILIEVAAVLTTILFFTRRSSAPLLIIGTECAIALWQLVLQIYEAAHHLLGHLSVGDVLWNVRFGWVEPLVYIGYFTLSKRVKATFIARYPQHPRKARPVDQTPGEIPLAKSETQVST